MLEVELIADYLIENSYVSSERDAYEFIPHMSDYWLSLVLEEVLNEETYSLYDVISEMRKEDKVKGKNKTPLNVMVPSETNAKGEAISRMERNSEGKLVKVTPKHKVMNPDIIPARYKQAMPTSTENRHPNYGAYVLDKSLRRHPHGGGETGVPEGRLRGKKKERGAQIPQPQSPVARFVEKRAAEKAKKEAREANRGRFGNSQAGFRFN